MSSGWDFLAELTVRGEKLRGVEIFTWLWIS